MPQRPLCVLSVAYPLFPVRPDSAGGAEQILLLLDRTLVESGHRSIVIASGNSQVAGRLVSTPQAAGEITDEVQSAARDGHAAAIQMVLEAENIDLIHFHGLDFYTYLPAARVPMVVTLHLPVDWYGTDLRKLTSVHLVCVSRAQAGCIPASCFVSVVGNGIDTKQYGPTVLPKDNLLWLGRVCPEKGTHVALQVAHALDARLVIAGPVHPFAYHEKYFAEQVEPLLDAKRVYVGPVGLDRKRKLLSEARCLLIPSSAPETSSLVAMEALASGTPVVAFRCGALPEVVEHGRTGFVVDSEGDMVAAIDAIGRISRELCVQTARARFDSSRMFAEYLEVYRNLLRCERS